MKISKNTEVTQRIDFSCCYLYYNGSNYQLDAHNFKFEATAVKSVINTENLLEFSRVLSFEIFRDLMKSVVPDKSFLCSGRSEEQLVGKAMKEVGIPVVHYEGPISAEVIINKLSSYLQDLLRQFPGVELKETKLRETVNSYVSWKPDKE